MTKHAAHATPDAPAWVAEVRSYLTRAAVAPDDVDAAVGILRAGYSLEAWEPNPHAWPFVAYILARHGALPAGGGFRPSPEDQEWAAAAFADHTDGWPGWTDLPVEELDLDAWDDGTDWPEPEASRCGRESIRDACER